MIIYYYLYNYFGVEMNVMTRGFDKIENYEILW